MCLFVYITVKYFNPCHFNSYEIVSFWLTKSVEKSVLLLIKFEKCDLQCSLPPPKSWCHRTLNDVIYRCHLHAQLGNCWCPNKPPLQNNTKQNIAGAWLVGEYFMLMRWTHLLSPLQNACFLKHGINTAGINTLEAYSTQRTWAV